MTHIEILNRCSKVIEDKIKVDEAYLDPYELAALKELRFQVFHWWIAEKNKEYVANIKSFLDYMNDVFPDEDEEVHTWENFHEMDFTITFGEKTVTLYNGADNYSDIQCLLDREYKEYKED